MLLLFELSLPLKDPVLVFCMVLLFILAAPLLFAKFKIPGVIALILAGTITGPNGFHLLERSDAVILFGTVGLLYIMFMAGLEIDLNDFKKNRNKSMVFGFFTFAIPMVLGSLASYFVLGFNIQSSILLASMFASHTLLSYPVVSRMGIAKNEAVTITVGGTIITDTAALLVLAVIAGSAKGELNADFWIRLGLSMAVFMGVVLWGFPKIARWFFRNVESEGGAQYIFVLAVVFASAFAAELAGVEPIIGAFLAGLALNRLIPHTSPLMNRIEFVGNNLFIPFFLIGVGMLVDIRVLFNGYEALLVAFVMVVVALLAKWLAAMLTKKIYGYTTDEGNIIFGLSSAQAAATLAAVLVGYQLEILNENVLNGTIVMILVTCLASSFVAENAAKRMAVLEAGKKPEEPVALERILVPIANPATMEQLLDMAIMVKNPESNEPVYPLSVIKDSDDAADQVIMFQKALEKAVKQASASETLLQPISRVDLNIAGGILRVIKELGATKLVIGWNGKTSAKNLFFGSVLDNLLEKTGKMILVTKLVYPLNTIKKLVVVMPPYADAETGFNDLLGTLRILARQTTGKIHFFGDEHVLQVVGERFKKAKPVIETVCEPFSDWEDFLILSREVSDHDLLLVVNARPHTISHNLHLDRVPKYLAKHFSKISFIVLYPEQKLG